VVHGIESADERMKAGKQAMGSIHIALHTTEDGMYELNMLDDGRGLTPAKIRSTLLRSGKYTQAELAELSDKQILMKIFEPGFTTASHTDKHAGHGVGLDIVSKKIEKLGARLRIATQKNTYTRFNIQFPT
jgi:chemotaxis protein histidine kinase CheA